MRDHTKAHSAEARLRELGGLGTDDSLRAAIQASALHGFAALLDAREAPACTPGELAALAFILAENVDRIMERQALDTARRREV